MLICPIFVPKEGFILPELGSMVKWGILLKQKSTGNSSFLLVIVSFINFLSLTLHSQKFISVLSMVISGNIALTSIKTLIGLQKSSSFSIILNLLVVTSSNFTAAKL